MARKREHQNGKANEHSEDDAEDVEKLSVLLAHVNSRYCQTEAADYNRKHGPWGEGRPG
jgi:hypothetical protein